MTLACIFDVGQYTTKIGFAAENEPRYTFFSITGIAKYSSIGIDTVKQIYVGNEVSESLGLYKIISPLENGQIIDFGMYEALIDYCFYCLRIDPTTVNVLYLVDPNMKKDVRAQIAKLFFEKYQVMGFYMINGSLLTMYSGGFNTGLVIDMGAAFIRLTPIYQGFIINHAVKSIELGGKVLDAYMRTLAIQLGYSDESSVQRELLRVLKERACFTSLNYEEDLKNSEKYQKAFALPDGTELKIGAERFLVPELLFKPDLNNLETSPFHKVIIDTIEECDVDTRPLILQNILLTGGASMFDQLDLRLKLELEKELIKRGRKDPQIRIIAPNERIFSNWIGGSILAMLPDFQSQWLSRADYFRTGLPDHFFS